MVVVSDFLDGLPDEGRIDAAPDWERPLRRLAARHQVLAVEVTDPRELELPDVGADHAGRPGDRRPARGLDRRTAGCGSGTPRRPPSSGRPVRRALRRAGAAHLPLRTDRDWVADIVRHVHAQRRLAVAAPARPRPGRCRMSFLAVPERLWLLARRASRSPSRTWSCSGGAAGTRCASPTCGCSTGWRRGGRPGGGTCPPALFLAMLALLVVGFARPTAEVRVPRERATVIIAVDVSTSMLANDVEPDRLAAAKAAAREFVAGLPEQFNVGLVAFAGSAVGARRRRSPTGTPSHDGIDRLAEGSTGIGGTAIGEAIDTSLEAVQHARRAGRRGPAAGPGGAALRRRQHLRPRPDGGRRRTP